MVWILTNFYTVFGDTVSLFLFINACLDMLLILIQSQRPVLKPFRSRDLPSVLCVLTALLLQLLLNISLLCYIAGGEDYQVFNAAWKYDEWHYLTRDEDYRREAVRVTIASSRCCASCPTSPTRPGSSTSGPGFILQEVTTWSSPLASTRLRRRPWRRSKRRKRIR